MKNLSGRAVQEHSRLVALAFATATLAAACGAGTSNDASFGESVEGATSQSGTSQSSAESDAEDVAAAEPGATGDSSSSSSVPVHLFPDLDVIDIQTGATINLAAELAGGDTPILLWFWAPH